MARILRKQNPPMQKQYQDYKPFLRLDFKYRCAYCTLHEGRHGGHHNFQVEHFRPKRQDLFPELALVYTNLYYACNRCNVIKGSKWPTQGQEAQGLRFVDPCEESLTVHFGDRGDGILASHTSAGQYMIDQIRLNRKPLIWERSRRRKALLEIREVMRNIRAIRKAIPNAQNPELLQQSVANLKKLIKLNVEAYLRPPVPSD